MTDLHEESGTIRYNDLSKAPETVVEVSEISSPADIKRISVTASRPGNDIELHRWSSRAVPDNRDSFRGILASEEARLGVIKLRGYICKYLPEAVYFWLEILTSTDSFRINPFA